MVERGLIGVDHSLGLFVNCWDCLAPEIKQKAIDLYSLAPDGLEMIVK